MLPLLLGLAAFAVWGLVGLTVLAVVGADTGSLRIVLTAPLLGSATIMLPLFVVSHAGVAMEAGAVPVTVVVVALAAVALVRYRPRLPITAAPVVVLCIVDLFVVGRPAFQFGFDWIANANDDMANYVLSATQLLHHGLLVPIDYVGLSQDRDFPSALQSLHNIGSRPGADITLSAFSAVTGRPPYQVFMPFILALNLCTICGAGALAMQAARRWWAASAAAALLVVSPEATFGTLQQLLPQVWGLGLAAALFAFLMRPELHGSPGPRVRDLVPIAILSVALFAVYVELAASLALAYGLYVMVLAVQKRVSLRAVALLWGTALGAALVLLNTYFFRELHYVGSQTSGGVTSVGVTESLFGYTLVPAALPGVLGLQLIPAHRTPHLALWIAFAAVLLTAITIACVVTTRRGAAASTVLVADLVLGVFLGIKSADFGLFKLYMYVQPFLAAAVAVWLSGVTKRWVLTVAAVLLAFLAVVQVRNQSRWIDRSRNPIDLAHASSPGLLPEFRRAFARTREPVVTVTENPTLGKLEAASVGNRSLYFISAPLFQHLVGADRKVPGGNVRRNLVELRNLDGWQGRTFSIPSSTNELGNVFEEATHASRVLAGGRCALAMPTGSEVVFNRRSLPEGPVGLRMVSCARAHNLLIFVSSTLGRGFYFPRPRKAVSFYQLEADYFYPGHTFSGFGRYVLLRVVGPSSGARLELDLTRSLVGDGSNRLPPAAVDGVTRAPLNLVGRGSARVFSAPLRPQMIAGSAYVLVDMGVDGRLRTEDRTGLQGLWGTSVHLDPRFLTSYVRDVSLVSAAQYRVLRAPAKLAHFPADLANPNVEYSGIYEDGWVAEKAYVLLAGGRAVDFVLRAQVLPQSRQHLDVRVDGKSVLSQDVDPGALDVRVKLPASRTRRRIDLRWAAVTQLGAPDLRPAAARLTFVGLVPRASS